MSGSKYVHGYSPFEQDRLVRQALYWRELIELDLEFQPGESVLEVGCGVGAVMGLIRSRFPNLKLSGIDIQPKQIEYARQYLPTIGVNDAELVVGDAAKLPWADATFDHVYMIWIVEHLRDPLPILREARRVLKPGGTIRLTETDYASIVPYPSSRAYTQYMDSFIEYFNQSGDAYVGRRLGSLLEQAGYCDVENRVVGYNWWNNKHAQKIDAHIDYLLEFIEPILDDVVAATGCEPQRLDAGVAYFRSLKSNPDGAISHAFYKGFGRSPRK